jgi:hypothetical protein
MDNSYLGASNVDDAYRKYLLVKDHYSRASMNVREFCSNSKILMERIPEIDRDPATSHKLLGLGWDTENYYIVFRFNKSSTDIPKK